MEKHTGDEGKAPEVTSKRTVQREDLRGPQKEIKAGPPSKGPQRRVPITPMRCLSQGVVLFVCRIDCGVRTLIPREMRARVEAVTGLSSEKKSSSDAKKKKVLI
ncbi:unnamed protein product [Cyprideis torosa]|uniref:Uncharacterized protein n=1 Tax=Cyprideis torosa TaxID=163714 RepID=A0A7R8ZJ21_9CRUS|nr:unnamed protein product [Cyprideis torosa]CAG0881318.1 unnamed protein product [Cyprideis torosa]